MIRLLRRLGRFPAGTETDYFDAAAEAAFVLDGTAARVECEGTRAENTHVIEAPARKLRESEPTAAQSAETAENAPEIADYASMKKNDLLREAMARGLEVSPRAKVAEIIAALEASDADA